VVSLRDEDSSSVVLTTPSTRRPPSSSGFRRPLVSIHLMAQSLPIKTSYDPSYIYSTVSLYSQAHKSCRHLDFLVPETYYCTLLILRSRLADLYSNSGELSENDDIVQRHVRTPPSWKALAIKTGCPSSSPPWMAPCNNECELGRLSKIVGKASAPEGCSCRS